jgi:hypothetical protein
MDIERQQAIAGQILATARAIIESPTRWTRRGEALTSRGELCTADDARAVRWSVSGAFYRAIHIVASTIDGPVIPGAVLARAVLARAIPACACTDRTFRANRRNALAVYAYAIEMLQRLTYADIERLNRVAS